MIRNISIRFLTVFVTFLIAGIFLILTLQRSIGLSESVARFQNGIILPLFRLSEKARELHLQTLVRPETDAFTRQANRPSGHMDEETRKIFGAIARFDGEILKDHSLQNDVATLQKEWKRYEKARVEYLDAQKRGTKDPSKIKRATTSYLVAYKMLANSIEDLKQHFLNRAGAWMQEEKRNIHATFYVSIVVASATLILLAFLLFEVNTINRKLQSYLQEREEYQQKLAAANKELARYSEELESEVKKRTEEAIDHLMKNPLTKLPNRLSFMKTLAESPRASVAIFNIDRFQSYNDLFGPKVGDRIIRDYAAYLRQTIPYVYPIYHLQGDEFAVAELEKKNAQTFLAMIRQAAKLAGEFHFSDTNGDFVLQISIGVAIDQEQPLVKADMALKHAKNSSESLVIYSDNLIRPRQYLENVTMTRELTAAIKEERIVPYLQPIAETGTLKTYKYEVLARLVDGKGKVHSPGSFIPLAKQIRLYPEITRIIFKKAMDIVEKYGLHLSINLSADDIHHLPTRNYIIDRLALSNSSDRITFELLESEETQNYEDIGHFIDRVKHYGVKIAIDDFGSGYSNFAKILKLRIDYLKIDGSFINRIDRDDDAREFVEIIYHLADNYNLKTVAEYVSDEKIYETVRAIGIDFVQGYYIAEPLPLEKVLETAVPPAKAKEPLPAEAEYDWDTL